MIVFLWEFAIPLIMFVIAYWRILVAVRRQANVTAAHHQNIPATAAVQPTPGTSQETIELANKGSTCNKSKKNKGVSKDMGYSCTRVGASI